MRAGFFIAGITGLVGLVSMVVTAIEMVASGRGLESYRTVWLIEFNWIGFLILIATFILALLIALGFQFHEYLLWRSLENKYGKRKASGD